MAKRLLLGLLVDVLGSYVEGLTEENLKVGVWSGKLQFTNLKLKKSALDNLNLPVTVSHGMLELLKIKVPWTSLDSKPVQVTIDGLYLQAGIIDLNLISIEDIKNMILTSKRKLLNAYSNELLSQFNKNDKSSTSMTMSYIEKLGMKILDNLEVTITNIHIRYEDNVSIQNQCFSTGVTIASINLRTTDDNWKEAFVVRGKDKSKDSVVHKLANMDNLSLYWNMNDKKPLNDYDNDTWKDIMKKMIYTNNSPYDQDLSPSFILHPQNNLSVKISHREKCTSVIPLIDMVVKSSLLTISLDKVQYQQIQALVTSFNQLEKHKLMYAYRPTQRPTENPKIWWKYAYKLVLGKDLSVEHKIDKIILCYKLKSKYIALLKDERVFLSKNPNKSFPNDQLISYIEDALPISALQVFRKEALDDMLKDDINKKKSGYLWNSTNTTDAPTTPKSNLQKSISSTSFEDTKKKSSMFSWMKTKSKTKDKDESMESPNTSIPSSIEYDDEYEDNKLMESILSNSSTSNDIEFPVRILLESSSSIDLKTNTLPVALVNSSLQFLFTITKEKMNITFALLDMLVEDTCSNNPYEKFVMKSKSIPISDDIISSNNYKSNKQFEFQYDAYTSGKVSIKIIAYPMDFTWNTLCIQRILEIFLSTPEFISYSILPDPRMIERLQEYAKNNVNIPENSGLVELVIELFHPTIIIPASITNDSAGYVILDGEYFSIKGQVASDGSIYIDSILKSINIGMPDTSLQRFQLAQLGTLYLIQPFDLLMKIQNYDKSVAVTSIDFIVRPFIQADVDAKKLKRLFSIFMIIIDTINGAFGSIEEDPTAAIKTKDKVLTNVSQSDDINNLVNIDIKVDQFIMKISTKIDHYFILYINQLYLKVLTTIYDVIVTLELKSITFDDSLRPELHKSLIYTPVFLQSKTIEEQSSNFIIKDNLAKLTILVISDVRSKRYTDFGLEVLIEFHKLGLILDDKSLLRLVPFLSELFESSTSVSNELTVAITSDKKVDKPEVDPNLIGMRIFITVDNVLADVLRPINLISNEIVYERSFLLDIKDFYMNYESVVREDSIATMLLSLQSFDVLDNRQISKDSIYKKLFSKSDIGKEYISVSKTNDTAISDLKIIDQNDKILVIKLKQDDISSNNVDIYVQDITTLVSIDGLVEFIEVAIANTFAFMAVLASMTPKSTSSNSDISASDTITEINADQNDVEFYRFNSKLTVKVTNPRLLILENPANINSKALVSKCEIIVYYTSDTENSTVRETIHVSLRDTEVFILPNGILQSDPQQIIDPLDIDMNLNKFSDSNELLSMKVFVILHTINIKVSIYDMIIIQSILNRIARISNQNSNNIKDNNTVNKIDDKIESTKLTIYDFNVQINTIYIITINDYNYQNLPIIRLYVNSIDGKISGTQMQLDGEISMLITSDHYNVNVGMYEPLIEPLYSLIEIKKSYSSMLVLFKSIQTIQINIATSMLKSLLQCIDVYNKVLLSYNKADTIIDNTSSSQTISKQPIIHEILGHSINKPVDNTLYKQDYPVIITNHLGIPIDVLEHRSKSLIVSLNEFETIPVERYILQIAFIGRKIDFNKSFSNNNSRINKQNNLDRYRDLNSSLPSHFDICFQGDLSSNYLPLLQVPVNINNTRHYYIQHKSNNEVAQDKIKQKELPIESTKSKLAPVFIGEPIVEVIYQYHRYDVLKQKWSQPWKKLGEPNEWTDSNNKSCPSPEEYPLPNNNLWEWVEPKWQVDMKGVIEKEIDNQGYEYGTNFSQFQNSKIKRRNFQPLDCVRRRRWIRTRRMRNLSEQVSSPRESKQLANTKPVVNVSKLTSIYWDVKINTNGCRNITIRSGFTITNSFPYDIMILLSYNNENDTKEFGPIKASDTYHVPILFSNPSLIQFKAVNIENKIFDWSNHIDCHVRSTNELSSNNISIGYYNIQCLDKTKVIIPSYVTDSDTYVYTPENLYLRITIDFKSKKHNIKITCLPIAILYNYLPCRFVYKCTTSDNYKENGILEPTNAYNIVKINPILKPMMHIQLGTYTWSKPKDLLPLLDILTNSISLINTNEKEYYYNLIDLYSPTDSNDGINLTMKVIFDQSIGSIKIYIYSIYCLIDRTGLDIMIKSKRARDNNTIIVRKSYHSSSNDPQSRELDPSECWINGGNGIVLFQSSNDNVSVGVYRGKAWSSNINISDNSNIKNTLEIIDKDSHVVYHLCYTISPMPYIFQETNILTIMPKYCIVNCMDDENIYIVNSQDNVSNESIIPSKSSIGWYQATGTNIKIRCQSTIYSYGSIDINDIGTSIVLLPHLESDLNNAVFLHIESKFSEPNDMSYISILVWKEVANERDSWGISIRNSYDLPITVRQEANTNISDEVLCKYEITINPNEWIPFAWIDPSLSNNIIVAIGTTITSIDPSLFCLMDISNVNDKKSISLSNSNSAFDKDIVNVSVQAVSNGKVIQISKQKSNMANDVADKYNIPMVESQYVLQFQLSFETVGISIIPDKPTRREFLSIYVDNIEFNYIQQNETTHLPTNKSIEFKISNIQVDNYSETVIYPVLFHSYNDDDPKFKRNKENNTSLPFIHFTIIQEIPLGLITPIYKYIGLRILELKLAVDSSTLQLLLLDIYNDIYGDKVSQIENIEETFRLLLPDTKLKWLNEYNTYICQSLYLLPLINDITYTQKLSQKSYKLFVIQLIIHPIKIKISFMLSNFPRNPKYDIFNMSSAVKNYSWIGILRGIAGIEELVIKVTSFIVNNVMESIDALLSRLVYKITREMQNQVLEIAGRVVGSLNVLGKPVGLYKNIGNGVQDFFYEPYQGAIESPEEFFKGVGRGTGSLVKGVVKGALSSTAAIVGTATNSVAIGATYLSGDSEFAKVREDRRRELVQSGGGVLAGIKAGGESVFTGFSSGLTGLITKPYEEGRKTGASGFLKGVGLGIVGVAVKPIMGVTDGIASVAQGVSNQVSDTLIISYVRPYRAFERSLSDINDLILVPLSIQAAEAQQYVINLAKSNNYKDSYLGYVNLGFHGGAKSDLPTGVILSEKYLFLVDNNGFCLHKYRCNDISYCQYIYDLNIVKLITYQGSSLKSDPSQVLRKQEESYVDIRCHSNTETKKLYALLSQFSYLMGNPSQIIPLDLIISKLESESESPLDSHIPKFTYQFGSVNHINFPTESLNTRGILNKGQNRLMKIIGDKEFNDITSLNIDSDDENENEMNNMLTEEEILTKKFFDQKMNDIYLKSIDERVMQLITDWKVNSTGTI